MQKKNLALKIKLGKRKKKEIKKKILAIVGMLN